MATDEDKAKATKLYEEDTSRMYQGEPGNCIQGLGYSGGPKMLKHKALNYTREGPPSPLPGDSFIDCTLGPPSLHPVLKASHEDTLQLIRDDNMNVMKYPDYLEDAAGSPHHKQFWERNFEIDTTK